MNKRVVRRTQAKRDLVNHFVYLAEHADIETAQRFLVAAEEACQLLAEMPETGAQRTFKNPKLANIRLWPLNHFREFILFYEPVENGIRLLRVIHAKEDYWRVLDS